MSTILVNSLKRLYAAGRVTREQIGERVKREIITEADYQEITGEAYGK